MASKYSYESTRFSEEAQYYHHQILFPQQETKQKQSFVQPVIPQGGKNRPNSTYFYSSQSTSGTGFPAFSSDNSAHMAHSYSRSAPSNTSNIPTSNTNSFATKQKDYNNEYFSDVSGSNSYSRYGWV